LENKAEEMNEFYSIPPRVNEFRRFFRVLTGRAVVVVGLVIIITLILMAIFAPLIAPYDPYKLDIVHRLETPSLQHWLGTDTVGRDTLSRVIYGTRTSLEIGLIAVSFAALVGVSLGTIAGFLGGWTYAIIMRIMDALMSFPMILLALMIAALLGGGIENVIIALAVGLMPGYARLMCGQVLVVKESDYILAARSMGANSWLIMIRHVILNCLPPIIVFVTMMLGSAILAEAGLSFLGIGVEAEVPTWGGMINDGREYLLSNPILSFAPGVALMLVVFGFNMVGDGLRDALDPRLRGMI
jgi:ABC-type dipeptide/oligopeptide/nickel transport system permease subunit